MEFMKLNIQLFGASGTLSCTTLSQDVVNNTSVVRVTFTVTRTSGTTWWGTPVRVTFNIDGQTLYSSVTLRQSPTTSGSCYVDATISHNNDGTKSFTATAKTDNTGTSAGVISASGTFTLATIARYVTNVSASQNDSSTDETSITVNWSCSENASAIKYGTNPDNMTEVAVSGTNGSFKISNLTHNTDYTIYLNIKRSDSGLYLPSNVQIAGKTYSYPYCNSAPAFNISDQLTLGFYNPKNRTIKISLTLADGTTTSQVDPTEKFNSTSWQNIFYNSIKNSAYGKYKVNVIYSGHTETRDGSNYYALENYCKPVYNASSSSIKDLNTTTKALTGSDTIIIKTASNASVTVAFTTNKFALASQVLINGQTATLTKGTTTEGATSYTANLTIGSMTTNSVTITIKDTRGFSTGEQRLTARDFKDYSSLANIITFTRPTPTGSVINIAFTGSYWSGNFGATNNSLTVQWRVKEKNTDTFSAWQTFTTYSLVGTTTTKKIYSGSNTTYERPVSISNPLASSREWSYQKAYVFETRTIDKTTTISSTIEVGKGIPVFDWYEKNGEYYFNINGKLAINGVVKNI